MTIYIERKISVCISSDFVTDDSNSFGMRR